MNHRGNKNCSNSSSLYDPTQSLWNAFYYHFYNLCFRATNWSAVLGCGEACRQTHLVINDLKFQGSALAHLCSHLKNEAQPGWEFWQCCEQPWPPSTPHPEPNRKNLYDLESVAGNKSPYSLWKVFACLFLGCYWGSGLAPACCHREQIAFSPKQKLMLLLTACKREKVTKLLASNKKYVVLNIFSKKYWSKALFMKLYVKSRIVPFPGGMLYKLNLLQCALFGSFSIQFISLSFQSGGFLSPVWCQQCYLQHWWMTVT